MAVRQCVIYFFDLTRVVIYWHGLLLSRNTRDQPSSTPDFKMVIRHFHFFVLTVDTHDLTVDLKADTHDFFLFFPPRFDCGHFFWFGTTTFFSKLWRKRHTSKKNCKPFLGKSGIQYSHFGPGLEVNLRRKPPPGRHFSDQNRADVSRIQYKNSKT